MLGHKTSSNKFKMTNVVWKVGRVGFPVGSDGKNPPEMQETWVGKIPWSRAWQPSSVFLPGESPWTKEPG